YVRKDGRFIWANLTVGCVRKLDGAIDYFLSVIEDITDRKLAETCLAERNAQLDLAGRIARIGSFMYDHGTKKLQLSPGCAAIYGLPEETLEISREDWRARGHPADLPQLDIIARRAFANGDREFVIEYRIFRHSEVRWIESRVLISYNEAGKPIRRIRAKVDVTASCDGLRRAVPLLSRRRPPTPNRGREHRHNLAQTGRGTATHFAGRA